MHYKMRERQLSLSCLRRDRHSKASVGGNIKDDKRADPKTRFFSGLSRILCKRICFFHNYWALYMVHKVKVATAFILTFTLCTIYI